MGRKSKKSAGLGRQLIKDRHKGIKKSDGSWLHTSDLKESEGPAYGLTSVTEESSLDSFLRTAQMAGTEFIAEKLDVTVVTGSRTDGLPTREEAIAIASAQEENKEFMTIPRRPSWTEEMSAEELDLKERDRFLEWRRQLAKLQENEALIMTPFEKNLAFWRQLWRVVERSDLVVQIVDARNPLLFYCKDLEKYVKEIDSRKQSLLLLNKSDLLTPEQRALWLEYFREHETTVAFFSALEEASRETAKCETSDDDTSDDDSASSSSSDGETEETSDGTRPRPSSSDVSKPDTKEESAPILSREELVDFFRSYHIKGEDVLTVGLVGYPNVGKSSTINSLLQTKRVPVSATPGRTKHFQTLFIDKSLCLCDCPGLVFPTFLSTKADMVCSGILPIDQMRDHTGPVSLVCQNIPRAILERTYGFYLVQPAEGEDPNRPPRANELLKAYGYMRGFMTAHGQPDCSRSARYILKDYVNGKLLYCHPPPDVDPKQFNRRDSDPDKETAKSLARDVEEVTLRQRPRYVNDVDEAFFSQVR
ncbi:large subunit GTPase 1 homolog isoform X2 [Oscarella lobularis]|uniref:large subunit GTPase 1 homolog isoform X2 n=1 Tax=Oscarella lobularis TaxID=121494 RepID=UPI0033133458